jgi:hypothetical protein
VNEPADGAPTVMPDELARALGVTRSARLQRLVRATGLAPEALLNLALDMLELASSGLAIEPEKRTAVALATARWRHIGPEARSAAGRRAVEARWRKRDAEGQEPDPRQGE